MGFSDPLLLSAFKQSREFTQLLLEICLASFLPLKCGRQISIGPACANNLQKVVKFTHFLQLDGVARAKVNGLVKPHYSCPVHKEYKEYQERLLNYKNWCIVFCTFLSIPLCLFCWAVNLNLAWTYYFTGILIASSVVPIALSILWARATAAGMYWRGRILFLIWDIMFWNKE